MIAETEKEVVLMLNISEVPSTMGLQNHLDELQLLILGLIILPKNMLTSFGK